MKTITNLRRCAFAALIMTFTVTTSWAQAPDIPLPSAEELAAQAAYEAKLQQIAAVTADRYTAIANIVATWETSWGQHQGWEAEFTAALEAANDERLAEIQDATSYDAVRAILQGQDAPVQLEGVSGTETLGSLTEDLVYSPVFPCRIFDTRNVGPAPGNNAVRHYFVHGTPGGLNAQGGNPAGCPAPRGEPVGISVNLAAVPVSSVGHLRVYPYLGVQPTASFLNYFGGGNIANSGIVTTCFNCGFDITVFNRNTSHSFADAMGYFYPVDTDDFEDKFAGSITTVSTANFLSNTCANDGGSVAIFTPGPGFVTVQAEVLIRHNHTAGLLDNAFVFLNTTPTGCTGADTAGGFYRGYSEAGSQLPSGSYYNVVTVSRKFNVTTAGNKFYYVNGIGDSSSKFFWLGKSATFHPQP